MRENAVFVEDDDTSGALQSIASGELVDDTSSDDDDNPELEVEEVRI